MASWVLMIAFVNRAFRAFRANVAVAIGHLRMHPLVDIMENLEKSKTPVI
ncbi:predicted protein [Sclerotinia sclerotiorum 1980 UF-70]|uniref:Uncharacterized protein n=1 Tax=Sclerotinia sclerotiorum (strain ATCC 18683 / 1980 / Ss-1) TaxID=665079 RepID=A7ES89_SCLS1|nr:predicted protein [Sclerotinia sclerotiorum 1980 UF-70]EDN92331.1 predicted protein [Sclerotinia sclerotiorum 1980 UF-70]